LGCSLKATVVKKKLVRACKVTRGLKTPKDQKKKGGGETPIQAVVLRPGGSRGGMEWAPKGQG